MSDVLFFNGRFTTTDERVLTVEDRGFLFADAVYEVFKFHHRRPVYLLEHFERLDRGLAAVEIANVWDFDSFRDTMCELLARTAFKDGIVYIQVSRGEAERAHFWQEGMQPTVVAFSRRFRFPDDGKKERGVVLATTADLRWKRCDIKSVNLLANAFSKKTAQRAGADEALLLADNIVRECASSSFFIVKDGRLITHPLDAHILPSITRNKVVELARAASMDVDERPIQLEELAPADEVFITSTTLGVMPVSRIDDGAARVRGPLTARLQQMLEEDETRSLDRPEISAVSA